MAFDQTQRNRLRWRSRRGMLELDLLLLPFFDAAFDTLPEPEQAAFARLLEQEDPVLQQWFSGNLIPEDPELARLVQQILHPVQPARRPL